MPGISITFHGDAWWEIENQMRSILQSRSASPSTAPEPTTLAQIFEQEEAQLEAEKNPDPAPDPTTLEATSSKPKTSRSHKRQTPPADTKPVFVKPEPQEPEPEPEAPSEALPSLDALKATVTAAVRAAQNDKGDKTILNLLPAFKEKTKLQFVANATEAHQQALYDLTVEAGLTPV